MGSSHSYRAGCVLLAPKESQPGVFVFYLYSKCSAKHSVIIEKKECKLCCWLIGDDIAWIIYNLHFSSVGSYSWQIVHKAKVYFNEENWS